MTVVADVMARVGGAILGTAVSLAAFQPRTRKGFWRRVIVSIPTGIVCTFVPYHFLKIPDGPEGVVAASFIMSGAAWWAVGAVRRFVERFGLD